eukprot:gene22884-30059_t
MASNLPEADLDTILLIVCAGDRVEFTALSSLQIYPPASSCTLQVAGLCLAKACPTAMTTSASYRGIVSCPICMDGEDSAWGVLECGHIFHESCATKWLRTTPQCPKCRDVKRVFIETELDICNTDKTDIIKVHRESFAKIMDLSQKLADADREKDDLAEKLASREERLAAVKVELKQTKRDATIMSEREAKERHDMTDRHKDEVRQIRAALRECTNNKNSLETDVQRLEAKTSRLEREIARQKISSNPTMGVGDINKLMGGSTEGLADVLAQRNKENLDLNQLLEQSRAEKEHIANAHVRELSAVRSAAAQELKECSRESERRGLEVNRLESYDTHGVPTGPPANIQFIVGQAKHHAQALAAQTLTLGSTMQIYPACVNLLPVQVNILDPRGLRLAVTWDLLVWVAGKHLRIPAPSPHTSDPLDALSAMFPSTRTTPFSHNSPKLVIRRSLPGIRIPSSSPQETASTVPGRCRPIFEYFITAKTDYHTASIMTS